MPGNSSDGDQSKIACSQLSHALEHGKKLKNDGNHLHSAEQFIEAAAKYEAARTMLRPRRENAEVALLEQSCSLNLASCHLKLQDWAAAEAACTDVLALDHSNFKALYRRGLARLSMISNHTLTESSGSDSRPAESSGSVPPENHTMTADTNGSCIGGGEAEIAGGSRCVKRTAERTLELAFGDLIGAWAVAPWDHAISIALQDLRCALLKHGLHARVAELDNTIAPSTAAFASSAPGDTAAGQRSHGHADSAQRLESAAARLRSDPAGLRAALLALREAKPATLAAYLRANAALGDGQCPKAPCPCFRAVALI